MLTHMIPLRLLCLAVLLSSSSALAATLPFQNLKLDVAGFPGAPRDWLVATPTSTRLDGTVKSQGASSLKLNATSDGQLARTGWDAKPWRGQTLTLSGKTRSTQVTGVLTFGTCFTERCPSSTPAPLAGTHDWTPFSLTLQVPQKADVLAISVQVSSGTLWLDDLSLAASGQRVPEALPFMGPDAEGLAWLKDNAQPLRLDLPDPNVVSTDDADLAPLGAVVAHARIVGLGEGTHGTHEFFTLKRRMVQYLVETQGFRVFALEANAALADAANRYIQGGPGQPEFLMAGTVWHTEEVLGLLKWMRLYNETAQEKLTFTGFDLGFNSGLTELNVIQEVVAKVEPAYLSKIQHLVTDLYRDYYSTYAPIDPNKTVNYQEDRKMAEMLLLHFQHQASSYKKALSVAEYDTLLRYARRVWQFTGMPIFGPYEYRDRMMARNLEDIARQYQGQKIVLWAHDLHVGRLPGKMGELLSQDFGPQYTAIGTLFGSGDYTAGPTLGQAVEEGNVAPPMYPGSVEQAFSQVGGPFFLDLSKARSVPAAAWLNSVQDMRITIGTVAAPFQIVRYNLAHLFDAVAFVPVGTSSKLLK